MKQYPLIQNFDGHKFEVRYSLSAIRGDFFVDGQGMLNVPDGLPDDPPIQETTDPPEVSLRNAAVVLVDSPQSGSKFVRGAALSLLDELNLHALKINSILDAVDAATSLADLKTRIAAIADYPQRTMAQAVTSIKSHITNGDVD